MSGLFHFLFGVTRLVATRTFSGFQLFEDGELEYSVLDFQCKPRFNINFFLRKCWKIGIGSNAGFILNQSLGKLVSNCTKTYLLRKNTLAK